MVRFTIVLLIFLTFHVYPQTTTQKTTIPKPTVAVLDLKVISGLTPEEASALTSKFRSALIQTRKYNVLERSDMEAILKEQDFSLSDNCNSAECAVQVGQLLAAEKMITGDIGKLGNTFTISVRIIDVSSSKIEDTQSAEYKGDPEGLIKTLDQMAQKLTGVYKKNNTLWYLLAGAAIAGGTAAIIMLMGGDGGSASATVGTPPSNPQ